VRPDRHFAVQRNHFSTRFPTVSSRGFAKAAIGFIPARAARLVDGRERGEGRAPVAWPRASLPLTADIHLNVLNNSYDRVHL
jgi:hypothetical protein